MFAPIIYALESRDISLSVVVGCYAERIIQGKAVPMSWRVSETANVDEALAIIEQICPSIILCGAGGNNKVEPLFVEAAKHMGIYCFSIADNWAHARRRFMDIDTNGNVCYLLPDLIGVSTAENIVELKSDPHFVDVSVVEVGMPHVEDTIGKFSALTREKIASIKLNQGLKADLPTFVFVPARVEREKWDEFYGSPAIGYSESTVFAHIVNILQEECKKQNKMVQMVIKPHPADPITHYDQMVRSFASIDSLDLVVVHNIEIPELLSISDCVIGMTSTVLLESAMCGRTTISVQVGLHPDIDNNVSWAHGISLVKSIGKLRKELGLVMAGKSRRKKEVLDHTYLQSTQTIVDIVAQKLVETG
ncbi:hypothetical protein OAJ78_00365 [Gammaproteobacteria bacterium]|nr:hypothetical protein [Gammaproteobacteria bacterium]